MQTSRPFDVAETLRALASHAIAGPATAAAVEYLADLFGRRNGAGIEMAVRALRLVADEAQVRAVCVAYTERLLG